MVGVAVKLAVAPVQIALPAGPAILTEGVIDGFTVIARLFDVTAVALIQVPVAVKSTVTA